MASLYRGVLFFLLCSCCRNYQHLLSLACWHCLPVGDCAIDPRSSANRVINHAHGQRQHLTHINATTCNGPVWLSNMASNGTFELLKQKLHIHWVNEDAERSLVWCGALTEGKAVKRKKFWRLAAWRVLILINKITSFILINYTTTMLLCSRNGGVCCCF